MDGSAAPRGEVIRPPLAELCRTPFAQLPAEMVVRAFGVDYGHICLPDSGELFVTRYGWPYLRHLLPSRWYEQKRYAVEGEKLYSGTGHVYHLTSKIPDSVPLDFVVKFSRVAQDVPLVVATTMPEDVSPGLLAEARFNSPMEEFGLVEELRRDDFRRRHPHVLTQRPLAIYAPPQEYKLWQLGRDEWRFQAHNQRLARDQEDAVKAIELDIKRIYVVLYQWIKGTDAQDLQEAGEIDEAEMRSLAQRVRQDLLERGFRVLDDKPKHHILRPQGDRAGLLRSRKGELVYGLVDFELLQRTSEYQREFKLRQRQKYRVLQERGERGAGEALPSHLKRMTIMGVDYLYGIAPDGGRVWVVGDDPDLFDFVLPERWRRTPRIKLSLSNEVYRTRTRDNILIVYRRSRVGSRPRVDPLREAGRRIREAGYNGPFEEVAIAERLRQLGVATTFPRAIFRTGHRSMKARHLRDERRFVEHADLVTPDPNSESILHPDYDYYTLWDYFAGGSAPKGTHDSVCNSNIDVETARERELLDDGEFADVVKRASGRACALGLIENELDPQEIVVMLDASGAVLRDADGQPRAMFSIDALTAYEYELLDDAGYRAVVSSIESRLLAADCEALNLSGKHILLSVDLTGRLLTDADGNVETTLCNFETVHGLYRPIR